MRISEAFAAAGIKRGAEAIQEYDFQATCDKCRYTGLLTSLTFTATDGAGDYQCPMCETPMYRAWNWDTGTPVEQSSEWKSMAFGDYAIDFRVDLMALSADGGAVAVLSVAD